MDESAERARHLESRLEEALRPWSRDPLKQVAKALARLSDKGKPLVVATLRGGIIPDDAWARSPLQPAVILSTVDQVGSSLLFRSYGGRSSRAWPIDAGLLGRDSLLIIDEAHCANPFCETVIAIAERWQSFAEIEVGRPLQVVRMSATLPEDPEFTLDGKDLRNRDIKRRLARPKETKLIAVNSSKHNHRSELVRRIKDIALELLDETESGVIGIVVNRVADARAVFESLDLEGNRKLLLTGRMRGWERDRLLKTWLPKMLAGITERPSPPTVVVSTQCIEVGANLDFDAMVTEAAPLDALRQRFGRLNRLGDRPTAKAFVVATTTQTATKDVADKTPDLEEKGRGRPPRKRRAAKDVVVKNPDPIYGDSLCQTWLWLQKLSDRNKGSIDMSVSALSEVLPKRRSELKKLCQGAKSAQVLLPSHLDLLAQTSFPPFPEPDISAFLHGTAAASPDVTLVWRCDLEEGGDSSWRDRVAVQPPATGEGCTVPIWEFKKWLAGKIIGEDAGDIEGASFGEDAGDIEGASESGKGGYLERKVLRWRGPEESEVVPANDVRPGDVIVVPSAYGGCDRYGWNPECKEPVEDIGDELRAIESLFFE